MFRDDFWIPPTRYKADTVQERVAQMRFQARLDELGRMPHMGPIPPMSWAHQSLYWHIRMPTQWQPLVLHCGEPLGGWCSACQNTGRLSNGRECMRCHLEK